MRYHFVFAPNDPRYSRDGFVPALEAGLVGDYVDGMPYKPDHGDILVDQLPAQYRQSTRRAIHLWYQDGLRQFYLPLMDRDNRKRIGTIYFHIRLTD